MDPSKMGPQMGPKWAPNKNGSPNGAQKKPIFVRDFFGAHLETGKVPGNLFVEAEGRLSEGLMAKADV